MKGAPPIAADPGGFPDFRICGFFRKMLIFGNLTVGFGVWEGLQWIGNGCGIQMDKFSAHFDLSESIFEDFHGFDHFAIVFDSLTLFAEGPRTLRDRPEGPGTVWGGVMVV